MAPTSRNKRPPQTVENQLRQSNDELVKLREKLQKQRENRKNYQKEYNANATPLTSQLLQDLVVSINKTEKDISELQERIKILQGDRQKQDDRQKRGRPLKKITAETVKYHRILDKYGEKPGNLTSDELDEVTEILNEASERNSSRLAEKAKALIAKQKVGGVRGKKTKTRQPNVRFEDGESEENAAERTIENNGGPSNRDTNNNDNSMANIFYGNEIDEEDIDDNAFIDDAGELIDRIAYNAKSSDVRNILKSNIYKRKFRNIASRIAKYKVERKLVNDWDYEENVALSFDDLVDAFSDKLFDPIMQQITEAKLTKRCQLNDEQIQVMKRVGVAVLALILADFAEMKILMNTRASVYEYTTLKALDLLIFMDDAQLDIVYTRALQNGISANVGRKYRNFTRTLIHFVQLRLLSQSRNFAFWYDQMKPSNRSSKIKLTDDDEIPKNLHLFIKRYLLLRFSNDNSRYLAVSIFVQMINFMCTKLLDTEVCESERAEAESIPQDVFENCINKAIRESCRVSVGDVHYLAGLTFDQADDIYDN